MNEIPKPPRPPEPTEVIGNDFIPKRPVPPDVARPPIQILYPDETSFSDRWTIGFYWGAFIGFGFGIIFIKILIKLGF
ncbi:hypothetical protein [Acinetobacter baumannii]|uniref:hypothetical protein n=1 Tax=Acinetobacter baumannii TaxID=470 RepID=UPI00028E1345|nr:hypothetical protein [Acinetobacter baumannii]EHU2349652.1 hypothetical protein [Acinetobacter baumannii]EHU2369970.1 hypothetical protein [Acinetobacter baumannii]EHU2572200.1 hypothetical protein [Acinetobacter baumannii]EKL41136.1 hypothetical protein ACIN5098_2677 [Acinetobacter baumannii OIFC098]KRR95719.1 hypothetical protein ASM30_01520 [Acinetobacter baumannii]